ncbi:CaiB/BaiF CoA transferase family protein [Pseudonocardia sp. DLS-67]
MTVVIESSSAERQAMELEGATRRPLEGVVVLDLTSALAGPYCTLLLAGLGARVIKLEPPAGDGNRNQPPYLGHDGIKMERTHAGDTSIGFLNRTRNKESITIDLKHPAARPVFDDLLRSSDVLVENFSAGTTERLGISYSEVRRINPRLVYCSITGFGSAGGPGRTKAFDSIVQALSGIMMVSGNEGDPPVKVGMPIADLAAPLFGTIGVLAALWDARSTGSGQHVDVSMLGALTSLVSSEPFSVLRQLGLPTRTGETVPRLSPFGLFRTKDAYVAISAGNDRLFAQLATVIGRPELAADLEYRTRDARAARWQQTDAIVTEWTARHSSQEVYSMLARASVPVAIVRDPVEAANDPEVVARGETESLPHPAGFQPDQPIMGPGVPIVFSESRVSLDRPAPLLAANSEDVLIGLLGYSRERYEELCLEGVLGNVRDRQVTR